MSDFGSEKFLTKPDLAMSMSDVSHWFEGQNSWLTFVGISAILVIILIILVIILTKLLLLNKTTETIKPVQATTENDITILTFHKIGYQIDSDSTNGNAFSFDLLLSVQTSYLDFDYMNTKYLHISSTGLTCIKTLTLDKTNVYLQLYDFTTCENVNMYMGNHTWKPRRHILCRTFYCGVSILR